MHPKTFLTSTCSSQISSSTFFIIISALLITKVLCSNKDIEVCVPSSCGNLSSISYPFWVFSKQESHCGHPNFKITCKNNKSPILRISNTDYLITHIDFHSYTFQLVYAIVYDETVTCPIPLHNISFEHTPFGFSSDEAYFYLFYNCSSPPSQLYAKYPISCADKNGSIFKSFGDFHVEVLELFNYSIGLCQSVIVVPVDIDVGQGHDEARYWHMNYKEILQEGFTLSWTDDDCTGCENSGGRCGYGNNQSICFCRDKTRSKNCNDGKNRRRIIIGVLVPVLGSIILLTALFFIYRRHHKRHQTSPPLVALNKSSSLSSATSDQQTLNRSTYFGVQLFTYKELVKATDNFNPLKELGDGGYGTVYYGKLRDGREVAIKRLYENNQKKAEQFMNEVEILAHLRHQNLVTLYGCTSRQSRELLLVYEYISNGTVAEHLHGKRARQGLLPWPKRRSIAVETACALVYLHASDIIHRDVKTQNILLDKDFSVKVADFGLSRLFPLDVSHVSTAPQGTPGYVDPEYHQCYQLTEKSDVYSFGVVLAELISSKPAVDITRRRQEINLSNMVVDKIQNHALHEFVDPSFGFETDFEVRNEITKVADLASQCLQSTRDMRPSMEKVWEMLRDIQGNGNEGDSKAADIVDLSSDDVLMSTGDHSPVSSPVTEAGSVQRYISHASV